MYINTLALQFSQENGFWRSVRIHSLGQYYSALKENPASICGALGCVPALYSHDCAQRFILTPKAWLLQTSKHIETILPTQMQNHKRRVYKPVHQRTHMVPVITMVSEKFHGFLSFVLL